MKLIVLQDGLSGIFNSLKKCQKKTVSKNLTHFTLFMGTKNGR